MKGLGGGDSVMAIMLAGLSVLAVAAEPAGGNLLQGGNCEALIPQITVCGCQAGQLSVVKGGPDGSGCLQLIAGALMNTASDGKLYNFGFVLGGGKGWDGNDGTSAVKVEPNTNYKVPSPLRGRFLT